jgi:hypothetical protein
MFRPAFQEIDTFAKIINHDNRAIERPEEPSGGFKAISLTTIVRK